MIYKRTELLTKITYNLGCLSECTSLENVIGLFDNNREAQVFFAGLFNLAFGYKLEVLDIKNRTTNYPGIDLGDIGNGISIQVTTDPSSQKIKDTITTFQKYKLYENYSRLVIFIIGTKWAYTRDFKTNGKFVFTPGKDIWYMKNLITEIGAIQENEKLEKIKSYLEEHLSIYQFPEILTPEDIKSCIEILKRDFGSVDSIRTRIENRTTDHMEKKNVLNKVTWNFFNRSIRGHIKYNRLINEFLSDPINKSIQKVYFSVAQAIQDYYHKNIAVVSFEDVFRSIFKSLQTYDDNVPGLNMKIKIVLHNMYFNCDIGDNPNGNT